MCYIVQGTSDIDQLGKIFSFFGTPTASQWPDMVFLPDYVEYQYVPAPPLRSVFPMASDDALDLLSKMFTYDPKARISVQQALEHRYLMLIFHFGALKLSFISLLISVSLFRYFTSAPLPTAPDKLPRPAPKRESRNSDFDPREGPTVLSPPRKSRRVMPQPEGFEGGEIRQPLGENTSTVPMSVDFSIFGAKPPNRPTINR